MWKEIGVIASVVTALSFIVASIIALISLRVNNRLRRTDLLNIGIRRRSLLAFRFNRP